MILIFVSDQNNHSYSYHPLILGCYKVLISKSICKVIFINFNQFNMSNYTA
jgi:hypothetical protein